MKAKLIASGASPGVSILAAGAHAVPDAPYAESSEFAVTNGCALSRIDCGSG